MEQPENAYYLATNTYFVINVVTKPAATCNLFYDAEEYDVINGITDFQGQVGHTYTINDGQYAEAVYLTVCGQAVNLKKLNCTAEKAAEQDLGLPGYL